MVYVDWSGREQEDAEMANMRRDAAEAALSARTERLERLARRASDLSEAAWRDYLHEWDATTEADRTRRATRERITRAKTIWRHRHERYWRIRNDFWASEWRLEELRRAY